MTHIDYEMPDYDYHDKSKNPHISSSDVKTVLSKSLLHWIGQERKESNAFDIAFFNAFPLLAFLSDISNQF